MNTLKSHHSVDYDHLKPLEIIHECNTINSKSVASIISNYPTLIDNIEIVIESIDGVRTTSTFKMYHDKNIEWLQKINLLAIQQKKLDEELKELREKKSKTPPKNDEKPPIDPFVQEMMNDPDVMKEMMLENPRIKEMIESNPKLKEMLMDSENIKKAIELSQNPNLFKENK